MLHTKARHIRRRKKKIIEIQKTQNVDSLQCPETKEELFVYWDSETMQDTGVHVPNMVCAAT